MTALPTRSVDAGPRHDGFPRWPEFDNPDVGMVPEWRVCGQDDGDGKPDELTDWLPTYDVAAEHYRVHENVVEDPYDMLWIEARWTTNPEKVKRP